MSSARNDLLIYVGMALATTIGLFVLHFWYGSFLDERYHASLAQRDASEALLAARDEDQKALASGKIPLPQAMSAIGRQGRPASVKPGPSADVSAVSGWIHQRGFKPQSAFPVYAAKAKPAAREPEPEAVPAAEPAAAAPAEPAAPAAKPPVRQLKLKTEVVKPTRSQVAQ